MKTAKTLGFAGSVPECPRWEVDEARGADRGREDIWKC